MNSSLLPALIIAIAALITAIATLISSLQTRSKVGETQRSVEHVHQKVDEATNGQHDQLVADLGELKQRVHNVEREMHTVYVAFVEQIDRRGGPLKWRKDRRK